MTTTKQSTFGATLRTTILLASLTGLLVVIGALIGGPSTAAIFLGIALLINLGSYFWRRQIGAGDEQSAADRGVRQPAPLPDRPRTDHARRAADAAPVHDPQRPAETPSRRAATRSTRRWR